MGTKQASYLEAYCKAEKARATVDSLKGFVEGMLSLLSDPENGIVENVDVGYSFKALSPRVKRFDGNKWPSINEIANALSDFQAAQETVKREWWELSDDEKTGVKPPN